MQRLDVQVAETMRNARGSKKKNDGNGEDEDMDEEDFMQEVEADREMRSQMNLYKQDMVAKKGNDEDAMNDGNQEEDDDDEDDQQIKLDELLDNLVLDAGPDDENDQQAEIEVDNSTYYMSRQEGEKAAKDGIGYVGRDAARQIQNKDTAIAKESFDEDFMTREF